MDQVEISVIMTVKNGEKFLESSLSSVFYQTHPPQEVVVVNDGSDDNTWDILMELHRRAPIPVKLVNTQGIGRSKALNLAVSHAQCRWLANIDADDKWLPEKLQKQALAIGIFPDAELVVTASQTVYGDGQGVSQIKGGFAITPMGRKSFYIRNPINHSSILFSRRLFYEVGGYNETMTRQVDIDLWIRMLQRGHTFYRVDLPLTIKRLHDAQSFEVGNRLGYTFSSFKISLKKLWKLKAPFYYFPIPFVKFAYNNIPRSFRRHLKK